MVVVAAGALIKIEHLLMHVTPSPAYLWLQAQMKPPGVLVQAALVLQLLSPGEVHSFISVMIRT